MAAINYPISITRGNTDNLTVTILSDGVELLLNTGDIVYFTVKKSVHTDHITFQKIITDFINGKISINILSSDTKFLPFGEYVYDCQVVFSDGTIKTIVGPSEFIVTEGVT